MISHPSALSLQRIALTAGLLIISLCSAAVDDNDLRNAAANTGEWLSYSRTYDGHRFVPLAQITTQNVARLRPAWAFSTGTLGGLEATPLLHDGMFYISADDALVYAIDARSGVLKWRYEPEYDEELFGKLCCGRVNRGLALYGDRVFVTTLDARLVALAKDSGAVIWTQTIGDWQSGYTATAAPLIVDGKVIVGIAGAEYGVRGYLKAYDAASGDPLWTTYTIPGSGEPGNDTWPNDTWKTGGASTWVTGAYDADLNLIYWGTGNPGPWNSDLRKGDNLWSSSMLALAADSGEIRWGYQFTPNDAWDFDGNGTPILTDVVIDGTTRKALLQSNRNGFLYVLDRSTGEFLYAQPTVPDINWTTGLDPASGRPTVDEAMRPQSGGPAIEPIIPALDGGTNWFPMAYHPDLNYLFVNSNDWAMALTAWPAEKVVYQPGSPYRGVDLRLYQHKDHIGRVMAFDLDKAEFVWETPNPLPLFAGLLATAGGLVFTGDLRGYMLALDAKTGKQLWHFQTGSGINAAPISYELDGIQYVAVLSGLGGIPGFLYSGPKGGMLWVFALDGGETATPKAWSETYDGGILRPLEP